jgi:hypothetical protein
VERDPRQDRDGLHVDVGGGQITAATLEHDPQNGYRFSLATSAERGYAEIMLKSKRWNGMTIWRKVIPL